MQDFLKFLSVPSVTLITFASLAVTVFILINWYFPDIITFQ
ncbi:Photosystem I reaction center subunit IX [Leptolyngbya sp. FACHB-261]|nr:Photosystem I reaction center subunit IX [Leptolyngbya sp. FACHB-261]MBD2104690.1 Photosystem I reaction center subunit IX [Leptolyngbya sp. FACHB-261]